MRFLAALVAAIAFHHPSPLHHSAANWPRPATPKAYARELVLARWHSIGEWYAEDAVVTPESGWNPCAVYGYHGSVCWYSGSNSCGIPQRNPCPYAWRGRLFVTRWAQVRDLQTYIAGRYGDPYGALAFREAHGWY